MNQHRHPYPSATPAQLGAQPALSPFPNGGMNNAAMGKTHGSQCTAAWVAGEGDSRPLLDVVRAEHLWRISVVGDVDCDISYGTGGTTTLRGIAAPIVASFPGAVSVRATPRDSSTATSAIICCSPNDSGGGGQLRRLLDAPGPIDVQANEFTALVASTVDVRGTVSAVAPGETIPVLSGSVLTAGAGIENLAP